MAQRSIIFAVQCVLGWALAQPVAGHRFTLDALTYEQRLLSAWVLGFAMHFVTFYANPKAERLPLVTQLARSFVSASMAVLLIVIVVHPTGIIKDPIAEMGIPIALCYYGIEFIAMLLKSGSPLLRGTINNQEVKDDSQK